jgi:urease accessory protein
MTVRVSKGATLYLLPDPVTCFKHASYNQLQTFHLEDGASLIVLDSFTSGTKVSWRGMGVLEVLQRQRRVGEWRRVAKDVMLLEQEKEGEVKNSRWKVYSL